VVERHVAAEALPAEAVVVELPMAAGEAVAVVVVDRIAAAEAAATNDLD
jgi:hypothetical protein